MPSELLLPDRQGAGLTSTTTRARKTPVPAVPTDARYLRGSVTEASQPGTRSRRLPHRYMHVSRILSAVRSYSALQHGLHGSSGVKVVAWKTPGRLEISGAAPTSPSADNDLTRLTRTHGTPPLSGPRAFGFVSGLWTLEHADPSITRATGGCVQRERCGCDDYAAFRALGQAHPPASVSPCQHGRRC